MEQTRERLTNIKKSQENWKHEAIDIAIEAINGCTHRDKEYHMKKLLMHLKGMPEITERDYGEESKDLPF